MMGAAAEVVGAMAGLFTTIAFIPQVIKTWRTRSTEDISLWMYLLFSSGVLLWLLYGVMLGSYPMMIANGITLGFSLSVLFLKARQLRARTRP